MPSERDEDASKWLKKLFEETALQKRVFDKKYKLLSNKRFALKHQIKSGTSCNEGKRKCSRNSIKKVINLVEGPHANKVRL